ncbi:predicted protein, partial [Nematostella vectensis]
IFEDEVASQTIPAQASGQIGDVKMDQLPGPEALLRPGKRSGQTIMVRRGQTVECHQWNDIEGKWDKIGEVVGAPGSEGTAASSSNKTMYKGKEYDYVFSVEIQEGKPPLKLPYNVTDDPWVAAHNFLEANDLSQMFLDQVVSFIQKNTANVTIGPPGSACDPFTGSSRYVPGSTPSHSSLSNQPSNTGGGAVDPFTGGGSYRPSYGSAGPPIVSANIGGAADPFTGGSSYRPAGQPPTGNPFFPKMDFVTFGNANTSGIWGKISEINEKLNTEEKLVQEEMQHLNAADPARASTQSLSEKQLLALNRARQWPADSLFPVLDIVRLVVRHQSLAANVSGPDLVEQLLMISGRDGLTANVLLSFRIFANLFSSADGKAVILQYREKIIERLMSWLDCANKNVHISICTVFLNFSVAYRKEPDFESQMTCLSELGTLRMEDIETTLMEGTLFRERHRKDFVIWTRIHVVVNTLSFSCYKRKEDATHMKPAILTIPLTELHVSLEERRTPVTRYCLNVRDKTGAELVLGASHESERDEWMRAILYAVCKAIVA